MPKKKPTRAQVESAARTLYEVGTIKANIHKRRPEELERWATRAPWVKRGFRAAARHAIRFGYVPPARKPVKR